jgi:tripeptide aminopeptidase
MHSTNINRQRLLDRFLQYVQIGTAANPNSDDYPSSDGQWKLGAILVEQLQSMGIADAHQDDHGLVWGTVPSTMGAHCKAILLNAHLDTSPEAPGDGCKPQVLENYDGNPIVLPSGDTIDLESTPELVDLVGHTLVTTDGTTLLGADDKAGVATIMECVQTWIETPSLPHGPIRILFTCDEEIGRGTRHFDLAKANAVVGYTLDGGAAGVIDVETFSADGATVIFRGRNTHPSVAKGKMVNSLRAAARFVELLPSDRLTPETTEARDGFVHPYTIHGGVSETSIQFILRDFDTKRLREYAQLLQQTADRVVNEFPGLTAQVQTVVQYRNMADALRKFPKAMELAEQAYRDLQMPFKRDSIRGGTDGALMSELGLPTPNLSVGQYNIHSVREFASLDYMAQAAEHLVRLAELWGAAN